jgi:hypothetical protein
MAALLPLLLAAVAAPSGFGDDYTAAIPPSAAVSRRLLYQTLGVQANQSLREAANGQLAMGTALAIQFVPLPPGDTARSTGASGNNGVYPTNAMPKLIPLSAVDYKTVAFREYEMASPENMCKMDEVVSLSLSLSLSLFHTHTHTHTQEHVAGNFTWGGCDLIANYSTDSAGPLAGMNGSYMGTCTVWGVWNPGWLGTLSPVQKEAALVDLVTATLQRYSGAGPFAMESLILVNEVANNALPPGSADYYKGSQWSSVPDFVAKVSLTLYLPAPL